MRMRREKFREVYGRRRGGKEDGMRRTEGYREEEQKIGPFPCASVSRPCARDILSAEDERPCQLTRATLQITAAHILFQTA